jgi:hypothetical protein
VTITVVGLFSGGGPWDKSVANIPPHIDHPPRIWRVSEFRQTPENWLAEGSPHLYPEATDSWLRIGTYALRSWTWDRIEQTFHAVYEWRGWDGD